ncbi:hypothetical protein Cni_G05916 [Canna indica]|uniref:Transcription repressor n=1 Tax=Canna indica TaxID=4628 RepID=A0AAQ3Q493_9LILI|nr:hypothetical protein Cni_G05916 [Canna indica]
MMESNKRRLKERLARMFRSPSLLRSSCNTSTTVTSKLSCGAASSRCLLNDVSALEARREDSVHDDTLGRSLSFPVRNDHLLPRMAAAQRRSVDFFDARKDDLKGKKESGVRETSAPASSPAKNSYLYMRCNKAMEEEATKERKKKKKKKKKKKRLLSNGYGFSSSSSAESDDDDDGDGFFSSDEGEAKEDETEAFFSSRSFSSDSSEFYQKPKNKNKKKKPPHPRRRGNGARKHESWGVCRGLQPAVSVTASSSADHHHKKKKKKKKEIKEKAMEEEEEEKKKRRSFAVVKRSSDPYGDFRGSMVEMIMERQIFGARDLESLLQSYVSLNARHLHPVILQAFSDIWVVLFGH